MNKTKQEIEKEINSTMGEIAELLKKSDVMYKDEDPEKDKVEDQVEAPPAAEQPAAPDATPEHEMAETPEQESEEHAMGEEAPDEGMEEKSMEEHAAELSDEELDEMLDCLMAEKEKRHAGAEPQAPTPEAPVPSMPEETEKSMKQEFSKMAKSMKDELDKMKAELDSLKKSQVAASKKQTISKPAAMNPTNVQVLEKSITPKQRLNKSETLDFLARKQRERTEGVGSDLIATVNACKNDQELHEIQDRIHKMGIKLPE